MSNLANLAHSEFWSDENRWSFSSQKIRQLCLFDLINFEENYSKKSEPVLDINRDSNEVIRLDLGGYHYLIEYTINNEDKVFLDFINFYLKELSLKKINFNAFDTNLTHTVNATDICNRLNISKEKFELQFNRLASVSLSITKERKFKNAVTSKTSRVLCELFSTNLIAEYVSFQEGSDIFYSFNYTQYFEKYYKNSLN